MSNTHDKINYLEFPAESLDKAKAFFKAVFKFSFTDYGPEYTASSCASAGIEGGFYQSPLKVSTQNGSVLVVIYSEKLEETKVKVEENAGSILKPIFEFPGGRRFHFSDPNGNEWAVWSDK